MVINRSESISDEYELHFLGLKVSGFEEMDNAKFNTQEFAFRFRENSSGIPEAPYGRDQVIFSQWFAHKKSPYKSWAFEINGGPWAIRTPDQLIKSQLLYQLS